MWRCCATFGSVVGLVVTTAVGVAFVRKQTMVGSVEEELRAADRTLLRAAWGGVPVDGLTVRGLRRAARKVTLRLGSYEGAYESVVSELLATSSVADLADYDDAYDRIETKLGRLKRDTQDASAVATGLALALAATLVVLLFPWFHRLFEAVRLRADLRKTTPSKSDGDDAPFGDTALRAGSATNFAESSTTRPRGKEKEMCPPPSDARLTPKNKTNIHTAAPPPPTTTTPDVPQRKRPSRDSGCDASDGFNLIEGIACPVVVAEDYDGTGLRIISCNPATAAVFGYGSTELQGEPVTVLMPADMGERHGEFVDAHERTGENKIIGRTAGRKVVGRHKSGELLQLVLNIAKTRSPGSERPRFIAVFQDVTVLTARTRELESAKTDLSLVTSGHDAFLQAMSVPVVVADETMTIRQTNAATSAVFGYRYEELLGQPVTILMPEQMRELHGSYVDTHMATGVQRIIGMTAGRKVVGQHKDGRELDLVLNIAKSKDVDGSYRFTAVFHDITDITALRDASSVLVNAQAQLLQSMSLAGMLLDSNGKIIAMNTATKALFGCEPHMLFGKPVTTILQDYDVQRFFARETATSPARSRIRSFPDDHSGSQSVEQELVGLKMDDGSKLSVIVHTMPTCDASGAERYLLLCEDVSQLRSKLERQTEELDIQRRILGQFTHEMRNKYSPSVTILETIKNLIVECSSPREFYRELQGLHDDIRLCAGLLREADDLVATRLELHKVYKGAYVSVANVEVVDLREQLLERAEAAGALSQGGVKFTAALPAAYDGLDVFVKVDMYMFKHIANNLLSNARKHTYVGTVSLTYEGDRDGQLEFNVKDTGRGIPETIASRLFKEEVATADCRGVGLGLSSCKVFALAIGGDVWLEHTKVCTVDDATGGTLFRFRLPGTVVETRPCENIVSRADADARLRGRRISIRRDTIDSEQSPSDVSSPLSDAGRLTSATKGIWDEAVAKDDREAKGAPRGGERGRESAAASPASPVSAPSDFVEIDEKGELSSIKFCICEDSAVIRRSVQMKLKHVSKQVVGSNWPISEFATVEAFLPNLKDFVDDPNVVVTVDENFDAQGGQLRGGDLIDALVGANFRGLIISASGDAASCKDHLSRGAHVVWSKPLPRTDRMLETLSVGWRALNNKGNDVVQGPTSPIVA